MESGLIIFLTAVVAIGLGAIGGYLFARMRSAVLLTQLEQQRSMAESLSREKEALQARLTDEKVECGRLIVAELIFGIKRTYHFSTGIIISISSLNLH